MVSCILFANVHQLLQIWPFDLPVIYPTAASTKTLQQQKNDALVKQPDWQIIYEN